MQKGDTLVVCDAGGGTVVRSKMSHIPKTSLMHIKDLISYVVEDTEPFVVSECVGGDGMFVKPSSSHITNRSQVIFAEVCFLTKSSSI